MYVSILFRDIEIDHEFLEALSALTRTQLNAKGTVSLPLTRKVSKSISHSLLRQWSARDVSPDSPNTTQLTTTNIGHVFLVPIGFGSQSFQAVIDTGSSDTWLVRRGFACISYVNGMREGQAECAFGPQYVESSTFTEIPNQNFNVTYGDGEYLRGVMGFEEVSLDNVTVPVQEVGAVDYAAWTGDGVSSGIVGLGYPGLTSAWEGSEQDASDDSVEEIYEPIFMSMVSQGLIEEPIFSLALARSNTSGGVLTIGGLPDQKDIAYANDFAKVSIEVLGSPEISGDDDFDMDYAFYAITIDGFPSPNASSRNSTSTGSHKPSQAKWPSITNVQAIVDSGTSLAYLPVPVSAAINGLFGSQGNYDPNSGTWFVDCNATAPSWSLVIGGQTFHIDPRDMIVEGPESNCVSGVQEAFSSFSILGDVFLKNVLAVFDVGNAEMRFAARH
ncbi:MAG: hypothetical protein M1822_008705 [Bathelium mastoideum]|nr:MAG: hypothetical protein M1822_008705 [Bathelium mastoideum]